MSVDTQPDIEELLRPISVEQPLGVDPRLDPSFTSDWRALRSAREDARRAEREAVNEGRSPSDSVPLWRNACDLAKRILSSGAKDVEAGCFLMESWVHLDGFEGLRRGLTVLNGLVKQYGNDLFPAPEEGEDAAQRMRPIERLCSPLAEALILLPITAAGENGAIATWQLQQAEESERDGRSAAVSIEAIRRTAHETRSETALPLLEQLDQSRHALKELDQSLTALYGAADAPSTSPLSAVIDLIHQSMHSLYGDRTAGDQPGAAGDATDSDGQPAGAQGGGPVRSRADAFRQLRQIADFFERMDPQCLLAAHIRRIVRLGNMSVAEYFSEIVEDKSARDQLFKLVGLAPPKDSD